MLAIKNTADRPFIDGRVVSPTTELYRVQWEKFVPLMMATGWLLPGLHGVREAKHEIWTINGVSIQFRSAHKPQRLRSWGGGWAILDESQDIATAAVNILLFCLREGGDRFHLYHQLTPQAGEALVRHDDHVAVAKEEPADCKVVSAASETNPFISHKVFDLARRRLDQATCKIEIEGDWEAVRAASIGGRVLYGFDRDVHGMHWPPARGIDITADVTKKRTGYARDYVAGVDYNWEWPNFAILLKVLAYADVPFDAPLSDLERRRLTQSALSDHRLQHWCVVAVISGKGHAGHLGAKLAEDGYDGKSVLVIDDASGQYNRGKNSKNSSSRLMRDAGFTVVHPSRNPGIRDAVNACNAKFSPTEGEPTLHVALPQALEMAEAAEGCIWDASGGKFDKSAGVDHAVDGLKYVVSYFCPAAKIVSGARGMAIR